MLNLSEDRKNKVLVTGGAGFIGSHLSNALVAQGYEVHILDNLSSGKLENVPTGATLHTGDIRSLDLLDSLFSEHCFPFVFHEAAQMSVIRSVENPIHDASVNILGLVTLLHTMSKHGRGKVIFASSGGVIYGEPTEIPQTEDHDLTPMSPYGIAKKTSEEYLRYYWEVHQMPYVALRYANVYGPKQNPLSGAGVIAIFMEKILNGQAPIINGNGAKTRDYVHVSDVISANLKAMKYDGVGSFNIGTSIETSVATLFHMIKDIAQVDLSEVYGEDKSGEQLRSALDFSKAKRFLDWEPKIKFADGLKDTVEWYLDSIKTKRLEVQEKVTENTV